MLRTTKLVDGFRHSTPYVNAHRNKTFVIMLSGEVIEHVQFRNIINDIALLQSLGIKIVLVYGARPQINAELEKANITSYFANGVRVTDKDSLAIIKQVAGSLQFDITARLSMSLINTPMQGAQISVVSGNFVIAQPLGVENGIDYSLSGKVRKIDVNSLRQRLEHGCIVVVGPIAASVTGESFNLTSEEIATKIAIKLKADKLICFCDQNGVLNDNGEVIAELLPAEAEAILAKTTNQSVVNKSIISALRACTDTSKAGAARSHIISYLEDGTLLQELFSRDGIGTKIVTESAESLRNASINDIGGILNLIRPLEEDGILVRRSREQLEIEINQFVVIDKDGMIIGCAALYPFEEDNAGEFACLAVHPSYREADRGRLLLKYLINIADQRGYNQLFALTTHSVHWFLEQGFSEVDVEALPNKKKQLYNYHRRSKVLVYDFKNKK